MPIIKRLPKRGFNSLNPVKYKTLSIAQLESMIKKNLINPANEITKDILVELGYIKKYQCQNQAIRWSR